jgi:lysophospholipase L1-like esterase
MSAPARADDAPGTLPAGGTASPQALAAAGPSGGLQMQVNERGHISKSVAASAGSTLAIRKPTGATVRAAYLAYATTGGTSTRLTTPLTLSGQNVPLTNEVGSGISSYNYFADVTNIVKPDIDAASPGQVNLPVSEPSPSLVDGEIITVIFDDPSVLVDETVSILYGALNPSGDVYGVSLARPISLSDPNTHLEMSLGISFSYQFGGSQQYSTVDVDGQRLTTSAGGEDDGFSANGGLITVGGEGDSIENPSDPAAAPSDPRSDDELYDLRPFVHDGDQSISVATENPSLDDNVFLAVFAMNPPVTGVSTNPGTLAIDPTYQERPVGAAASFDVHNPGPFLPHPYKLTVLSGPNAGRAVDFACTVCFSGTAGEPLTYAYTPGPGGSIGVDTLEVWLDSNENGVRDADEDFGTVQVRWNKAVHAVGMGDSYSAGEGVDPYDPGTDDDYGNNRNQCHRSAYAYARQSKPLGYVDLLPTYVGGPTDTALAFIACSGATTDNVRLGGTAQYTEPGTQLEQGKLDDRTDLVTLTLGGNDIGFSTVLKKCAKQDCLKTSTRINGQWVEDWAAAKLVDLPNRLVPVLRSIRADAPNASVVLLGYPRLFPTDAEHQGCAGLTPFNAGEQDWLNGNAAILNQVMSDAAATAGVHFLSALDQFAGHSVCGRNGSWIAGLTAPNLPDVFHGNIVGTGSFHPTEDGQTLGYAAALNTFLAAPSPTGRNDAGLPVNPEPTAARSFATASSASLAGELGDLYVLADESDPRASCLDNGLAISGSKVRVAGEGFAPNSDVSISWDASENGEVAPVPVATLTADDHGAIQGTLTIPSASIDTLALLEATGSTLDGSPIELLGMVGVARPCAYQFAGFFSPVNNMPTINSMNAGRAVPIKFSLGGDFGLAVVAQGSPTSVAVDCGTQAAVDEVEQTLTAGASSLSYDPVADQYSYVWKTKDSWAGTCRKFTMKLDDGTSHSALFKFR